MKIFIRSLYIDLHNRLNRMIQHLDELSMSDSAASLFKKATIIELNKLRKKCHHIVDSGILEEAFFTPNTVIKYNSINNELIEIELFRYLPISRYNNNAEGYFEKVIKSIYQEINSLQSVPFISTISNSDSYFWAYSKYGMIALPQGEEKHLLNLSDLYHEVGHLTFEQSEQFLIANHCRTSKKYFEGKKKTYTASKKKVALMQKSLDYWDSRWSEELSCDLIATYLVGPAYAWTNMKLCAVSSGLNEIYSRKEIFKDHPPDEVRMRAILRMLELTGHTADRTEIESAWNTFISVPMNEKPSDYDEIFPEELIDSICTNVLNGCKSIVLRSYLEQLKHNTRPISQIINEAWTKIRNEPERFSQWESEQIANIQSLTFI